MSSELWISLHRGVLVLHLLLLAFAGETYLCLSPSPFSFFLLFFSSSFFLLSCFKFIKTFCYMLNPIGFIVLPFRYRFIIHSGEDGVIVEVKFYLFFFSYEG